MEFPVDLLDRVDPEYLEHSAEDYMSKLRSGNPDVRDCFTLPHSKQIEVGLRNIGFVPLYGENIKQKVLALFLPEDLFTVVGLYLLDQWWSVEDILKTRNPSRTGLLKVTTLGERIVLYVLNRIIFRTKEMTCDDVQFLCHGENEIAKIFWKDGEAIGFYSVKAEGSLCGLFSTQCYQLPVMDTIFVRKSHRGNGYGLHMLEDFVDGFRSNFLGLKYPLKTAMYKVCQQYLSKYPADTEVLWEVEGIGSSFQKTRISKRLQAIEAKGNHAVVSRLNVEADRTNTITEEEITQAERTVQYTEEVEEIIYIKSTKKVEDTPVTASYGRTNLKHKLREEIGETPKKIIRAEVAETGEQCLVDEPLCEDGVRPFNVKEDAAVTLTQGVADESVVTHPQCEDHKESAEPKECVPDDQIQPVTEEATITSEEAFRKTEVTAVMTRHSVKGTEEIKTVTVEERNLNPVHISSLEVHKDNENLIGSIKQSVEKEGNLKTEYLNPKTTDDSNLKERAAATEMVPAEDGQNTKEVTSVWKGSVEPLNLDKISHQQTSGSVAAKGSSELQDEGSQELDRNNVSSRSREERRAEKEEKEETASQIEPSEQEHTDEDVVKTAGSENKVMDDGTVHVATGASEETDERNDEKMEEGAVKHDPCRVPELTVVGQGQVHDEEPMKEASTVKETPAEDPNCKPNQIDDEESDTLTKLVQEDNSDIAHKEELKRRHADNPQSTGISVRRSKRLKEQAGETESTKTGKRDLDAERTEKEFSEEEKKTMDSCPQDENNMQENVKEVTEQDTNTSEDPGDATAARTYGEKPPDLQDAEAVKGVEVEAAHDEDHEEEPTAGRAPENKQGQNIMASTSGMKLQQTSVVLEDCNKVSLIQTSGTEMSAKTMQRQERVNKTNIAEEEKTLEEMNEGVCITENLELNVELCTDNTPRRDTEQEENILEKEKLEVDKVREITIEVDYTAIEAPSDNSKTQSDEQEGVGLVQGESVQSRCPNPEEETLTSIRLRNRTVIVKSPPQRRSKPGVHPDIESMDMEALIVDKIVDQGQQREICTKRKDSTDKSEVISDKQEEKNITESEAAKAKVLTDGGKNTVLDKIEEQMKTVEENINAGLCTSELEEENEDEECEDQTKDEEGEPVVKIKQDLRGRSSTSTSPEKRSPRRKTHLPQGKGSPGEKTEAETAKQVHEEEETEKSQGKRKVPGELTPRQSKRLATKSI
ncbi:uncharacterized protein fam169aa [Brachyhypopomus gauderio]|uniref:uncharacterized protein fam169aa n=1 Tax=Brachyhypopomus gauderio TaxID=698409 RepID=UPI004042AA66